MRNIVILRAFERHGRAVPPGVTLRVPVEEAAALLAAGDAELAQGEEPLPAPPEPAPKPAPKPVKE